MSFRTTAHATVARYSRRLIGALIAAVLVAGGLSIVGFADQPADAYCYSGTQYQFNGLSGRVDEKANNGTCNYNNLYGGKTRDNFYDNVQSYLQYKPNNQLYTAYPYKDSRRWRNYTAQDNDQLFQWRSCYQSWSCSGWFTNHGA